MSDLPRLCIMKLLQSLWLLHTADLPDELFFWKDNAELLGNFRVGLIEGSGSDFSIDPGKHTIYIPRSIGTFSTMQTNLKEFVDSL